MAQAETISTSNVADKLCPSCGYDLRGISSERCPECGLNLDGLAEVTVPWEFRGSIGHFKAYWRTMKQVIFRPGRLAICMASSVDRRAARRFAALVILAASFPLIAALTWAEWRNDGAGFLNAVGEPPVSLTMLPQQTVPEWEFRFLWSAGATLVPTLPVALLLTFLLIVVAPRLWFRAGRLAQEYRQRAASLSLYAAAPLAWLTLPVFTLALAIAIEAGGLSEELQGIYFLLMIVTGALLLTILVLLWWGTVQLLFRTTHANLGHRAVIALYIPISWAISAAVGLGAFPCLIGLGRVAIESLR